jgi:hypothetical protein
MSQFVRSSRDIEIAATATSAFAGEVIKSVSVIGIRKYGDWIMTSEDRYMMSTAL